MPITLTSTMLTGFGAPSPSTLLSAGFAGLAVFLMLRNPAGQLRRMTRRKSRPAQAVAPLRRLIAGRADAPPLLRRVLLSLACALALGLAGSGGRRPVGTLDLVRGTSRRGNWSAGAWMGRTAVSTPPPPTVDHGGAAGVGADGCLSRSWGAGAYGVRGGGTDIRRPCR